MSKFFKFEKEVAQNIGLVKSILYQFIKEQKKKINLNEIVEEFSFLSQDEIVSAISDLSDKGLSDFNHHKEQISLKTDFLKKKTLAPSYRQSTRIESDWQPSDDVYEILKRSGIEEVFIDDLVDEFIVYWKDRPSALISFNSKFIEYVRIKWAQHTAEIDTKTSPTVIDNSWKPSSDCFDIIKMTGISKEFAEKLLPEFILYWKNDGRAFISWDIKFLDFIKNKWNFETEASSNGSVQKFDFYNPYEDDTQVKKTKDIAKLKELRNKYKI